MKTEFVRSGRGYDVFINNLFVLWVVGSKRNAEKELEIYLKE
jgi:hypothetical protein